MNDARIMKTSCPRVPVQTLACFLASAVFFAAPSAAKAQGDGDLPVKKTTPFLDQRALKIPGKVPSLSAKARPKVLPRKGFPKPTLKNEVPPPPPPPPRGRSSGATAPAFADLKRTTNGKCKPPRSTERFTFDFEGDIKQLVDTIAKKMCKNFIITNKVRSQKFEIVAPTPVTATDIWRAFLSSLEANDLTLVRVGKYYKIIQATDGTRSPVPMYEDDPNMPVNDAMVTVIWRLKHGGDPGNVVNYLNIFKTNKGQIHPFQATGVIIATDFATSIDRLKRILDEIDQPGALEQVHVVPVEYATATEIAEKLTQVFEPAAGGKGAAPKAINTRLKVTSKKTPAAAAKADEGEEGAVAVSKILADDRTNKLIIIASERAFKQIISLMRELDIPEGTNGDGQIHVLRLKHADAEELSSTLASLAQGKPTTTTRRTARGNAAAKAPAAGAAALFQGEVKITADKATNSLVITASKSDVASIKRVIEKLDVPRFQVFVEAVILEVSIKRDRRLGVGWHAGIAPTIGDEQTPIVFANTPNNELSSLLAAANPLGLASLLGLAGAVSGPTLPGTDTIVSGGIPAIGVVVQALQSTNDVNVVSTPHLLTMDNEEAEIQVNEKRPFPSGLTLGGLGGLGGLANQAGGAAGQLGGALGGLGGLGLGSLSFNREDIGLTLKLKPQINDEDYVRLEIDQELSDVAGIDQVTGQTITSKRSAKTVVVVRSQDSVVIGGLVRDRESIDESKTPLLGDLPLIGWLFKRQAKVTEKVNLLLILTPYIIRGPDDFRTIFERKMEERKDFVDRFYGATPEYRAAIDWNRKVGPLGGYKFRMQKELSKAENEGPGAPGETVIRPEVSTDGDVVPVTDDGMPAGEPSEATPEIE